LNIGDILFRQFLAPFLMTVVAIMWSSGTGSEVLSGIVAPRVG
jgi:hypothetical protein